METEAARASSKREISSSGSEEGGGVVTSERWQEWEQVRRRKKGKAVKSGGGRSPVKGGVPPGARSGVSLGNPFGVLSSSSDSEEEEGV